MWQESPFNQQNNGNKILQPRFHEWTKIDSPLYTGKTGVMSTPISRWGKQSKEITV